MAKPANMPKLTKGVVSKDEAAKLAPAYVRYISGRDRNAFYNRVLPAFDKLRVGQTVLAFVEGVYVKAKVTSIQQPN